MSSESILKDLVAAVNALYRACPNLPFKASDEMEATLRAADKAQLYLNGDFEGLWMMEREENERLRSGLSAANASQKQPLQSVQVHEAKAPILNPEDMDDGDIESDGGFGSPMVGLEILPKECPLSPISTAPSRLLLATTPNLGPLLPSPLTTRPAAFTLDI
jgi:hypothetical protein